MAIWAALANQLTSACVWLAFPALCPLDTAHEAPLLCLRRVVILSNVCFPWANFEGLMSFFFSNFFI